MYLGLHSPNKSINKASVYVALRFGTLFCALILIDTKTLYLWDFEQLNIIYLVPFFALQLVLKALFY